MNWFTIGPQALDRMKKNTVSIRTTIGTREIAQKVRGLTDDQLGAFLNDVLALVDDAESILSRVRQDTPSRALPKPFAEGGARPDTRSFPRGTGGAPPAGGAPGTGR